MAGKFDPPPYVPTKILPSILQDWLRRFYLQVLGASGTGSIVWTNINFTSSNITDIQTRNHNNLQNIQGGTTSNFWHLKTALKGTKSAFDFGTVSAVSTATTTLTITGATTTSTVSVSPTTALTAGLTVYGYVSSADTVTLVCVNASTSSLAAGTKTYNVLVLDN